MLAINGDSNGEERGKNPHGETLSVGKYIFIVLPHHVTLKLVDLCWHLMA